MSDKSTPTPWKVTERHYVDAPIGDGRLQEVAYCGDCEVGSRNANARLIVTAVNYHHRLREALGEVITDSEAFGMPTIETLNEIEATLAELDNLENGS